MKLITHLVVHSVMAATFTLTLGQYCDKTIDPFVTRSGDVLLIGLFDVRQGNRCDRLQRGGFEQLYSAAWFVDWLNNRSYTKGIRLGMNLYDTCNDVQNSLRLAVHGLSASGYAERQECRSESVLGFIGPLSNPAKESVSSFLSHLTIPYVPLKITTLKYEIEALVSVLSQLDWRKITLLASSLELQSTFHQRATAEGICITVSVTVENQDITKFDHLFRSIRKTESKVVVMLGTESDLIEALRTARFHNMTRLYWLVAGPSVHSSNLFNLEARNSVSAMLVAQPNDDNYPLITNSLIRRSVQMTKLGEEVLAEYSSLNIDCRLNISMMRNPLCKLYQMHVLDSGIDAVIRAILRLVDTLMHLHQLHCGSTWTMCSALRNQFERKMWKLLPSTTGVNLNLQEVKSDKKQISLWAYQMGRTHPFQFGEVGLYSRGNLRLDSHAMNIIQPVGSGWYKIPEFQCTDDCSCENRISVSGFSGTTAVWKSNTWITICVTVSCTGTVMVLAFACYIVARICRRDIIEGSQGFALCILLGIIACYVSILPYGFEPSENICALRLLLSAAYTTLFSPIVARCLMLATTDSGGLPGHISGLVQCAVYVFALAVQGGLSAQYWWLNYKRHSVSHPVHCTADNFTVFVSMVYPCVLLFFWLLLSPFCIRNRRNYREGLTFQIASVLCLCVWVTWISLCFIFPDGWRDPSLCLGVVATATIVLLTVFVPRIYKMATSIALDAVNVSLRPIGQLMAPNLTEMSVRDLQNMYDNASHTYAADRSRLSPKNGANGTAYEECSSSTAKTTHL